LSRSAQQEKTKRRKGEGAMPVGLEEAVEVVGMAECALTSC